MRKKKEIPINTTARGRCVIPIENGMLLMKVIRRLEADGIPFEVEDVEDAAWVALKDTCTIITKVPMHGPATVITYGTKV